MEDEATHSSPSHFSTSSVSTGIQPEDQNFPRPQRQDTEQRIGTPATSVASLSFASLAASFVSAIDHQTAASPSIYATTGHTAGYSNISDPRLSRFKRQTARNRNERLTAKEHHVTRAAGEAAAAERLLYVREATISIVQIHPSPGPNRHDTIPKAIDTHSNTSRYIGSPSKKQYQSYHALEGDDTLSTIIFPIRLAHTPAVCSKQAFHPPMICPFRSRRLKYQPAHLSP